jgi:F0F1-type ATP synthase assembly protein I
VPQRPRKPLSVWAQVGFYTSLGFILPAGAVGGYFVGWALDEWLHTRPVLALVMSGLGAAGGFIEILRILTRAERNVGGNDNSGSEPGAS